MTINDLRFDIIAVASQLTDVNTLEKIRAEIAESKEIVESGERKRKGAETELRTSVSLAI